MCNTHITGVTHYVGGTLVRSTRSNIDKTARTAREMAEVQREAYGAVAENFAAVQRRSMGLAEGGLEFVGLQEQSARAAQRWLADSARLVQLQQRNAEFVQGWAGSAVEAARERTERSQAAGELSPFAYAQEGMRIFQRATQRGLGAAEQTSREGLRAAERATDQAGEVLSQTEEALREAELRTEVYGSLGTADYDGLAVEEAAKRLEGLSTDQLEKVGEFEKNNKNRETLIERIDSRIRANF
jgi:hypothetical protein